MLFDNERGGSRRLLVEKAGLPPEIPLDADSVFEALDLLEDAGTRLSVLACDGMIPGSEPAVAARIEGINAAGDLSVAAFRLRKAAQQRANEGRVLPFRPPITDQPTSLLAMPEN